MQLPRGVLVGEDILEELPGFLRSLGLSGRCLLVTGESTRRVAGERVGEILQEHAPEMVTVESATQDEVARVVERARRAGASFLVGVGGGKVIDVAKLSSYRLGLEFVSIPTAASHDGIASSMASLRSNGMPVSENAVAPLGIVADTRIIASAPRRLTASGFGDAIAKLTATMDWELAHRVLGEELSEYSIALSRMSARIAMRSCGDAHTVAGVRRLVKALISCGVAMSIAGSSRPGSGAEHKFSHALDMIAAKPALHGEQVGVGSIIAMYLHGGEWWRIRSALKLAGAPVSAQELGVEDREVILALLEARKVKPERYTIIEHVNLSREMAEKAARATGVIE
ncbi:MAG: NAD(P)-dependent glycerol-1-phosphate dehydrogenase [Euryarchaeota archaeon]|nr:NAD(P)-dependent glycerol-1-phosphate dehydrogenase [Euryarchaeota archaeon]